MTIQLVSVFQIFGGDFNNLVPSCWGNSRFIGLLKIKMQAGKQ